jgi:hypothetical protein
MRLTSFPKGIQVCGVPFYGGAGQDNSGTTYFVDNNCGSDSNDGLSWEAPLKTFARAVVLNNIDIARGSDRWARRNTIYYAADTETATIVAFPNKCDVIGVGSYDANSKPGITGNHAPVNPGNYGTRFFNIWFKGPAVASPIITLANSSSGIQFHGCTFSATSTTTTAITSTASPFLKIFNCRFEGAVATATISIGAGEAGGTEIVGNDILESAAVGILVNAATTTSWRSVIKDNLIQAATLTVDDNSDLFYIINNRLISAAAVTTIATCAEASDINAKRGSGNYLTADNVTNVLWPYTDTTT